MGAHTDPSAVAAASHTDLDAPLPSALGRFASTSRPFVGCILIGESPPPPAPFARDPGLVCCGPARPAAERDSQGSGPGAARAVLPGGRVPRRRRDPEARPSPALLHRLPQPSACVCVCARPGVGEHDMRARRGGGCNRLGLAPGGLHL